MLLILLKALSVAYVLGIAVSIPYLATSESLVAARVRNVLHIP